MFRLFFALAFFVVFASAANLEEIKLALVKEYKNNFPQLIIKNITLKTNSLPKDFNSLKFIRLANARFNKANGYVKAEFFDSQNIKRSVFFRYFIKASLQVLRANKDINRGENLVATDYNLVLMDFDRVPLGALSSTDDLNIVSKTVIKKNAILKKNMFKEIDLIKRNDNIMGILKDLGVNMMVELKAIEGGKMGEKIRLKNKEGKVVEGLIIDKNTVQIQWKF